MNHWLMKTEPEEFSWDDLVKRGAKGEPWTGVRNFTARGHMKEMKKGDLVFIYHTGKEKQIVGVGEVIKEHYRDPTDEKQRVRGDRCNRQASAEDAGDARHCERPMRASRTCRW